MVETFVPACYSKAQTVAALRSMLAIAPKQEAGSLEALQGHVFEVHDMFGLQGVATLSELYECAGAREVDIKTTDGIVRLHREGDGKWVEIERA